MKRFSAILVLLVMVLAFGLVLASCDSGSDGGEVGGGEDNSRLVGTWRGYWDDGEQVTLVLKSNYTFTWTNAWYGDETSGPYWVYGNTITLAANGESLDGEIYGNAIYFYDYDIEFYRY